MRAISLSFLLSIRNHILVFHMASVNQPQTCIDRMMRNKNLKSTQRTRAYYVGGREWRQTAFTWRGDCITLVSFAVDMGYWGAYI